MKQESGNFWHRYEGDSYARYSPFRGQGLAGMDFAGFKQSLGGFIRAATRLDGKSSRRSWTAMMRSIKFLDWFDSISGRLSWEGRKAQIQSENPTWSDQRVLQETAIRSFNDVRSTQNTSSAMDAAGLAMRLRNNPLRMFLLFTTDSNKSLNQLIEAYHQGPKNGFRASVGVLGNMVWSGFITQLFLQTTTDIAAAAIAAALGRDINEKERERQRQRSFERSKIRFVKEILGLYFFADILVDAWEGATNPFRRAEIARSPLGEVIGDMANGVGEMERAVTDLLDGPFKIEEGEMDKFTKDMIRGMKRLGTSGTTLVGNPFLTPYYRVRPIFQQLSEDEANDEARLKNLKPELK